MDQPIIKRQLQPSNPPTPQHREISAPSQYANRNEDMKYEHMEEERYATSRLREETNKVDNNDEETGGFMDDSSLPNGFLDIPKLSVLKTNKKAISDKGEETERKVDSEECICFIINFKNY